MGCCGVSTVGPTSGRLGRRGRRSEPATSSASHHQPTVQWRHSYSFDSLPGSLARPSLHWPRPAAAVCSGAPNGRLAAGDRDHRERVCTSTNEGDGRTRQQRRHDTPRNNRAGRVTSCDLCRYEQYGNRSRPDCAFGRLLQEIHLRSALESADIIESVIQ